MKATYHLLGPVPLRPLRSTIEALLRTYEDVSQIWPMDKGVLQFQVKDGRWFEIKISEKQRAEQ